MGRQMDIFSSFSFSFTSPTFCSYLAKKAHVLFVPSQEKLKFLFLLGTENTVGGRGSLAVYAILF